MGAEATGGSTMNIYINEKLDAALVKNIKLEAEQVRRSVSYVIRERLRAAYAQEAKR
jgi:hypothetical protein